MTNIDISRYKRIVQYFWDPEPTNDDPSRAPIWCLGEQYPCPTTTKQQPPRASSSSSQGSPYKDNDPDASRSPAELVTPDTSFSGSPEDVLAYGNSNGVVDAGWPVAFLDDFESRIWLRYRSNFPPIPRSRDPDAAPAVSISVRLRSQLLEPGGFTSDTGWGCMIRSGQCLLANALVMLRFGREWRRGRRWKDESSLLSLFADDPRATFSIHRFVEHGASACGKHPGEWFGPSATARCIQFAPRQLMSVTLRPTDRIRRALTNEYPSAGLRVYMTADGSDICEDAFMDIARPDGGRFWPTLVLVGIRLGIDRVTPVYWEALTASLRMRQSIGIAGGRPSSSLYFIGVQGSYLFYLDPHQTRPALLRHDDLEQCTDEEIDSCHSRRLRRLHLREMDPSMLIAFLIRDEADWFDWRQSMSQTPGKPIIHVTDRAVTMSRHDSERSSALDEVETFDDDDDDGDDDDGEMVTISASDV